VEYSDLTRGVIQFKQRAKQIIDFSGLRFKNITPTDVDGMIEYQDKGFVFYEYKLRDAQMSRGQRLALERLARNNETAGKRSTVLVCSHTTDDPKQSVDAASAKVVELYYNGKWEKPSKSLSAFEVTQRFIKFLDGEKKKGI